MNPLRPTLVLTLLPAVLLTAPVRAQDSSPTSPKSTISVDARLVVLPAVVRDKKGALVNGLTRDSFALQVDGKVQALRYFDHDTDVPLTLGLLIDTSGSVRDVLDEERTASAAFLDKMLVPHRDKAFLIQFARTVELLQDVTDERGKLQAALKEVDSEKPSFGGSGGGSNDPGDNQDSQRGDTGGSRQGGRGRGGSSGGGTALYDAVFLAAEDVLAKQPRGRRALVLLTDGDDRGSKETLAKSIESAQRSDVILYAIYYKGKEPGSGGRGFGGGGPFGGLGGQRGGGYPGGGGGGGRGGGGGQGGGRQEQRVDGRKVLERMCGETGGRVFEVTKKETVDKIYGEIGEELRSQYRIGFTPSADAASEGYHQVSVSVTGTAVDKKTVVQTRDGYYTRQ